MTQKERSHVFYAQRKSSGLCPRCGKPLDRQGHYCSECLAKDNEYRRESRTFYREHNICTMCRKQIVPGDEVICPECRVKIAERKPPTPEQSERYRKRFREQQRALYQERSAQGICVRCGKRRAMPGRKRCGICLEKDALAQRKHRFGDRDLKTERLSMGLCYRCGEPLDRDGKMCQKCVDRCRRGAAPPSEGHIWRQENKLIGKRCD